MNPAKRSTSSPPACIAPSGGPGSWHQADFITFGEFLHPTFTTWGRNCADVAATPCPLVRRNLLCGVFTESLQRWRPLWCPWSRPRRLTRPSLYRRSCRRVHDRCGGSGHKAIYRQQASDQFAACPRRKSCCSSTGRHNQRKRHSTCPSMACHGWIISRDMTGTSIWSMCGAMVARRVRLRWTSLPRAILHRQNRCRDPRRRFCDRLHPPATRNHEINLIGWSWGTVIMAAYAAEHADKVARLVLYGPQWLESSPATSSPPLGAYVAAPMALVKRAHPDRRS